MIEKVTRLVSKDYVYEEGFVSFLVSQMSRELADRVIDKIVNDGECICTYKGVEALEYPKTEQVEMRSGIDIHPLVRCKDCKHRPTGTGVNHDIEFPDEKCPCQCPDDYWYSWMPNDDWFCAEGERKEITYD